MKRRLFRANLLVLLLLCAGLGFSTQMERTPEPEEVLRQVVGVLRSDKVGYYPPLYLLEQKVALSGLGDETIRGLGSPGRDEDANAIVYEYLRNGMTDRWDPALVAALNKGVARDGLFITVSPPFRDGDRWCCYVTMPYTDAVPGELVKYLLLLEFDWERGKVTEVEELGIFVSDRFRTFR